MENPEMSSCGESRASRICGVLRNGQGLLIQDRLGNDFSGKSRLCSGILPQSGARNCAWLALLFVAMANAYQAR